MSIDLWVIEHWSDYGQTYELEGLAYGIETAWGVAEKVLNKYHTQEIDKFVKVDEGVFFQGYRSGAGGPGHPYVKISPAGLWITDFTELVKLLKDMVAVLDGVKQGFEYGEQNYWQDVSAGAEIMSFFNGYEGSPDLFAVKDKIEKLLGNAQKDTGSTE